MRTIEIYDTTLRDDIVRILGESAAVLKAAGSERPLAIHCHNDCDLAVANSLAAVAAGALQMRGTINGLGERCGNVEAETETETETE